MQRSARGCVAGHGTPIRSCVCPLRPREPRCRVRSSFLRGACHRLPTMAHTAPVTPWPRAPSALSELRSSRPAKAPCPCVLRAPEAPCYRRPPGAALQQRRIPGKVAEAQAPQNQGPWPACSAGCVKRVRDRGRPGRVQQEPTGTGQHLRTRLWGLASALPPGWGGTHCAPILEPAHCARIFLLQTSRK